MIWLIQVSLWLKGGIYFWVYLLLLSIIIMYGRCYFALIGNILQFFESIFLVLGLNGKIKLFNNITPSRHYLNYFKSFPGLKSKHIIIRPGTLNISLISNEIEINLIKKPVKTFEDVIRYIDERLLTFDGKFKHLKNQIIEDLNNLKKTQNDQDERFNLNINKIEEKLRSSNISNIERELFAIGCIIAGLAFSIIPVLLD